MRALLVLVCLAAAGSVPARAAQGSAEARPVRWVEAVRTHVPGEADAALAAIAARRDRGTATILLEDGRDVGRREPSEHWGIALALTKTLAAHEEPAGPRIALRWFHAVTALHQSLADCPLVERHLAEGLLRWPDDARLHLYRGTLHQTYADARLQQFVRRRNNGRPALLVRRQAGGGAGAQPPGPTAAVWERQIAEAAFRRALALDPALDEARIRLAHVVDRGKVDEAVALAEAALATPLPPFFETYAALVPGRNQARAGRFDEARAAVERAAALAPDAQAPRIGLAQVALAHRRAADAHAGLATALRAEVR
jgi:tetratricopeptide (TPR) repeat protein